MSFDVSFLRLLPGQDWDDAMSALEEPADDERPLGDADLTTWASMREALLPLLPDAEEYAGERSRELSDDATGIQLSLHPGCRLDPRPHPPVAAGDHRVVDGRDPPPSPPGTGRSWWSRQLGR